MRSVPPLFSRAARRLDVGVSEDDARSVLALLPKFRMEWNEARPSDPLSPKPMIGRPLPYRPNLAEHIDWGPAMKREHSNGMVDATCHSRVAGGNFVEPDFNQYEATRF